MPQHRDFRLPHHAHRCLIRTRGNHSGSRYNPRSRAVFVPHDRTLRENVDETRKHQDAGSPTTTPALAGVDRQATPHTKACQRSRDLIEVASLTNTQLTA